MQLIRNLARILKAFVGLRHRFRPTYPGFPVKIGGVGQLHAAFFERKPHTCSWLVLRSRKSGQRRCEHGAPRRCCGLSGVVGYWELLDRGAARPRRLSYLGTGLVVGAADCFGAVFALETTDHEMTLGNSLKMLGE